MLITCDANINMGYIYLRPPNSLSEYSLEDSEIGLYFDTENLAIPRIKGPGMGRKLSKLPVAKITYVEGVNRAFHCEYWNDVDEEGYLIGIELDLSEETFLDLISYQAFIIYETRWRNEEFRVLTLDAHHNVIKNSNKIYPLTTENDTFVIMSIDPNSKVGYIKALITKREDLYPTDYLSNPLFMLSNSKRYFKKI